MPQFREQIAEVVTVILQERTPWCVSFETCHNKIMGVTGSVAKHRIRRRERERWRRLAAFLQASRQILGEKFSCPSCRARSRAAFHSHPWSQHAIWSSPRSRARFNRACVRRALASLSTTAMLFLQHGGVNPAGGPASSMA